LATLDTTYPSMQPSHASPGLTLGCGN